MHANTLKVGDWVTFDNPYSLPVPVLKFKSYSTNHTNICGKILSIDNDIVKVKQYNNKIENIEIPYWFLKCINPTDINGNLLSIGDTVYIVYDKTMMVKGTYVKETGPKYVKYIGYKIGTRVEYTNKYGKTEGCINHGPQSIIKI